MKLHLPVAATAALLLLALPVRGHDPSKEIEALQTQLMAERGKAAAAEREVREWKSKVDMHQQSAQRYEALFKEKPEEFARLMDQSNRQADRVFQVMERAETLQQRSEVEWPIVVAALEHASAEVRVKAAKAAGARGPAAKAAVPKLEALKGDQNPAVSAAAEEALAKIRR